MNSIVVDVGANHGDFCLQVAKSNPSVQVIAIEPNELLFNELVKKKSDNIELCCCAISDHESVADFNISKEGDWGCSSLLNYNQNNLSVDKYWSQRNDLGKFSEKVKVKTNTLYNILLTKSFDQIAFIKIDTQGYDLIVLHSLGSMLSLVQAGVVEAYTCDSKSIYENDNGSLKNILNFLSNNDLEVYKIKPNDESCNEVNVFFKKKDVDINKLETEYKLRELELYSGKDFWYYPQSNYPSRILPITENFIQDIFNRITSIGILHNNLLKSIEDVNEKLGFYISLEEKNNEKISNILLYNVYFRFSLFRYYFLSKFHLSRKERVRYKNKYLYVRKLITK